MDIEAVAEVLYAVAPEDFTATRDARAREARQAGAAGLAAAIKALRKPSRSAWLVNQLVRHRQEEIDQLLDLGAALREAQDALAGDALRELSARRRSVVDALGRAARELAAALGAPVGEAVEREVTATLDAALADPDAAEQVRSGCLTSALRYSGFGAGGGAEPATHARAKPDITTAGGRRGTAGRQAPPAAVGKQRPRTTGRDRDDAARQRAAAELTEARRAAQSAAAAYAEAHEKVRAAMARREEAVRRIATLEEDLAHARREDAAAAEEVRVARKRSDDREREQRLARERLVRAEKRAGRAKA